MIKEFFIDLYLLFFKAFFVLCKCFALQKKIVFVCSYPENIHCILEEMRRRQFSCTFVFLCRGRGATDHFVQLGEHVLPVESANPFLLACAAYHLATAKLVVIDNYFAFLSVASFKKGVQCIQLWHACGAFKTFGLMDHSVKFRTNRARKRFIAVYRHFDKIVVGSDAMQTIFMHSFGLDETRFVHLGIPRTDLFFDQKLQKKISQKKQQLWNGKKVILYAPTFRDQPNDQMGSGIDLKQMEDALSDEYVLILRLHPADQRTLDKAVFNSNFVFDGSGWTDVNKLLLNVDLLITDYSSIPFEFALLKRPMIFFPYDLASYEKNRGLWGKYKEMVPGPVAVSTQEVIRCIEDNQFDLNRIESFSNKWNCYSTGQSSNRVADYLINVLNE
ncbi:CDP-glycerol glycerophosphotransferase family protein [Sporolactobacillus sp. CPB3-1]|uniref:CDP-glycerol glycerophosphotransferase family protein n=1 Tax=Sporolactobacillus mangiferae TaxID=2940498 RepID=A0ABT0M806_9BACL|nr:CDP-glycerol glycerophosphotransferase family protein [Sporolactobacillus mangiferae]MCL1631005.1 CDP-glycerol glycerophosphotransferase family protein [Sporolactobacillus mangiferae]